MSEETRVHIQYKGNKKSVDKMMKLAKKIEALDIEVKLTIEKNKPKVRKK